LRLGQLRFVAGALPRGRDGDGAEHRHGGMVRKKRRPNEGPLRVLAFRIIPNQEKPARPRAGTDRQDPVRAVGAQRQRAFIEHGGAGTRAVRQRQPQFRRLPRQQEKGGLVQPNAVMVEQGLLLPERDFKGRPFQAAADHDERAI
jgi:hypothetical protein